MILKKSYIEVEVETASRVVATKAFTINNLYSVGVSLITIFLRQINYIFKKILNNLGFLKN